MHDRPDAEHSSALWKCTDVTLGETDTEGPKISKNFLSPPSCFILTVIRATVRRDWNNQTGCNRRISSTIAFSTSWNWRPSLNAHLLELSGGRSTI